MQHNYTHSFFLLSSLFWYMSYTHTVRQITFDAWSPLEKYTDELLGLKPDQYAFLYYYSKDFTLARATDMHGNLQKKVAASTVYLDFQNETVENVPDPYSSACTIIRYRKAGAPERPLRPEDLLQCSMLSHKPSFAAQFMKACFTSFWKTEKEAFEPISNQQILSVNNDNFICVGSKKRRADPALYQDFKPASNDVRIPDFRVSKGWFWNTHERYSYVPKITTQFTQHLNAHLYEVEVQKTNKIWQPEQNKKTLNLLTTVSAIAATAALFVGVCKRYGE